MKYTFSTICVASILMGSTAFAQEAIKQIRPESRPVTADAPVAEPNVAAATIAAAIVAEVVGDPAVTAEAASVPAPKPLVKVEPAPAGPKVGWVHAAPGLGQHEGTFTGADDAYGLNYACAAGYSQIGLRAKGMHIAAGESTISVDGFPVITGNTTYNSKWDGTSFTNQVEAEWGETLKEAHNKLVMALARGTEAVWTTPSGTEFKISLSGSADIKYCKAE
jgi:hypothetical protein